MHPLILLLLLAVGASAAVYWQKLTCPYELRYENLLRVWCRQSSNDCCMGLAFSKNAHLVDGGNLMVTEGSHSFTVAMLEPSHEDGIYWCGVLMTNNTIIKLAEGYFHSSSGAYIWSYTRWILLPLLPMTTIFITIYTSKTTHHMCKKAEEPYDDIGLSRALADPQYANAASLCELE